MLDAWCMLDGSWLMAQGSMAGGGPVPGPRAWRRAPGPKGGPIGAKMILEKIGKAMEPKKQDLDSSALEHMGVQRIHPTHTYNYLLKVI